MLPNQTESLVLQKGTSKGREVQTCPSILRQARLEAA